MTERWERELEKLVTLQPPASLRRRFHEGPRGEGVPPMPGRGQRVAAGIVAFAVFAGAAALVLGAFGGGNPSPLATPTDGLSHPTDGLVVTLDAPEDGTLPTITLEYSGTETDFTTCGGRWNGERIGCTLMLLSFDTPLEPGTILVVHGDADAVEGDLHVVDQDRRSTDETIPLDLADGSAPLPDEQGFYGLSLRGTWPAGTAGLYIVITMGEPEVLEASPLPEVEPGVVPDLIGVGEGDAYKLLFRADLEGETTVTPVAGVANGLVASTDPSAGDRVGEGSVVQLVVSGTTAFAEGTVSVLDCSYEDQMPFAHDGPVLGPAGETNIRVNTPGIRDTDEVFKGEDAPAGAASNEGWWLVDRSGEIIAVVDYESLEGVACRGSEIGGV